MSRTKICTTNNAKTFVFRAFTKTDAHNYLDHSRIRALSNSLKLLTVFLYLKKAVYFFLSFLSRFSDF